MSHRESVQQALLEIRQCGDVYCPHCIGNARTVMNSVEELIQQLDAASDALETVRLIEELRPTEETGFAAVIMTKSFTEIGVGSTQHQNPEPIKGGTVILACLRAAVTAKREAEGMT